MMLDDGRAIPYSKLNIDTNGSIPESGQNKTPV